MKSRDKAQLFVLVLKFFFFPNHMSFAADTISSGQSLTVNQTLISKGGKFELGFFAPGTSLNYYIGIWYKNIPNKTVVWVANRDTPLTDPTSSEFKLLQYGNLVLLNESKIAIWSTDLMSNVNVSSEAQLGDDGNLVLRTGVTPSDIVWQSFDYPTDTFLPGAKVGYDRITNKQQSLTSWKNSNDPAKGLYSLELDRAGDQYFIQSNQNRYWNSGPWNGQSFSLVPEMGLNFNLRYVRNEEESYFTSSSDNTSILSRIVMDFSGQFKQFSWLEDTQEWLLIWSQPRQQCEVYRYCGPYGLCNQLSLPFCNCLEGFEPRSPKDWNMGEFSGGCVRQASLPCGTKGGFLQVQLVKWPDNQRSFHVSTAEDCKLSCLNDCSCSAFALNKSSCLLWNGDLFNLQQFKEGDAGVDVSVQLRLADASDIPSSGGKKPLNAYIIVLIAGSIFISISGCFLFGYKMKQRGKNKFRETTLADLSINHPTEQNKLELPAFDFNTLAKATNNFSNKLGQGGFGSVYKGKLLNEQEIAVKRLSGSSGQGVQEFKNELMLISKLQHRNLVRLLGYCIDREEKILLYEYMPNKSLDMFLFDPTRQILLDWEKRFNIIDGIARGLLYLHRDSRLKVIHRDLKASNILLDEDMNPKISDFGMARIFGGKQTFASTNRIVGTYGYMSPEYAMEGIFSEKSDVFSFGVLLLETVSSKKNRKFYFLEESYNLLGYVWRKWNENKVLELMDPLVAESYNLRQLSRCIHIGLLCVQESVNDRPTMSAIVSMLGSEGILPLPKKLAFTIEKAQSSDDIFNMNDTISLNSITITNPEGR